MGKLAVITEKQSVAQDIISVLGGFENKKEYFESPDYVVLWAVGHILSLPNPEEIDPAYKRWTLDTLPMIPEKFELKPLSGHKGRLDQMSKVFRRKDVEAIVNACDAGREGELIFREIIDFSGTDKPIRRLWLQSMTADAIREGFTNLAPGEEFDGLAAAAFCRSEADWLVGMNATRGVTRRLQSRKKRDVWSAGRVQTPTLALLVHHEFRILEFEPRPYWRILSTFQAPDHTYESSWFDPKWEGNPELGERDDRVFEKDRAEKILEAVRGKPATASETRKPEKESAPLLFDLTSLQREANRRFSYSARRTLQAAQRLYEAHKVLTYPRTDSKHLPEDYRGHVQKVLDEFSSTSQFGKFASDIKNRGLLNEQKIFNDKKVSDHFAIIPTGKVPRGLERDDAKIFDLVMRRFLAAFYPQAVWNRVERFTEVDGENFRVRSRTLQVPGWREVMGAEEEAEEQLPPLVSSAEANDPTATVKHEGVPVQTADAQLEESVSKPPGRITEGRLLGMMERAGKDFEDEELAEALEGRGLGTPATRADTIENLISKQYIQRTRNGLKPAAKGIRLIDFLHRIDSGGLASAELSGEWEKHLAEVEKGEMKRSQFMEGIATFTREVVEKIKTFEYDDLYANEKPVGKCPQHPDSDVIEFFWGYRCTQEDPAAKSDGDASNGCSFIIWKDVSGRYIDRKTASTLLREGKTAKIPGFVSLQGEEYEASLVVEDGNQVRVIGEGVATEGAIEEKAGDSIGACPCGEACEVLETNIRFVCKNLLEAGPNTKPKDAGSCGFVLPKLVCKREMSMEEVNEYLTNGRTGVLEGFISKRGRPFPAILYRKENGRHGFEFLPREPKKPGAKKAKKKTTKKKAKRKTKT